MPLNFFSIPVFHLPPAQDELNDFLATHRVPWLEKQWLQETRQAHGCAVVWSELR